MQLPSMLCWREKVGITLLSTLQSMHGVIELRGRQRRKLKVFGGFEVEEILRDRSICQMQVSFGEDFNS
jgi:hypothetical protein